MEDFELQEQHLSDAQAFDTLVGFTGLEVRDANSALFVASRFFHVCLGDLWVNRLELAHSII